MVSTSAVHVFRLSLVDVSLWRTEFDPRSVNVDLVALGEAFLRVLRSIPVTIIPPMTHNLM